MPGRWPRRFESRSANLTERATKPPAGRSGAARRILPRPISLLPTFSLGFALPIALIAVVPAVAAEGTLDTGALTPQTESSRSAAELTNTGAIARVGAEPQKATTGSAEKPNAPPPTVQNPHPALPQ